MLWLDFNAHGQSVSLVDSGNSLPTRKKDSLSCHWGYQLNGEWVIKPQFDLAWEFSTVDSVAEVMQNEHRGLINLSGEVILEPTATYISPITIDWNNTYPYLREVQYEDSTKLYNTRLQKFHFTFPGNAIAYLDSQIFRISKSVTTPCQHTYEWGCDSIVSEGLASLDQVIVPLQTEPSYYIGKGRIIRVEDGLYYLYTTTGKKLSEQGLPYIAPAWAMSFLVYTENGLQGLLDSNGNKVTDAKWKIPARLQRKDFPSIRGDLLIVQKPSTEKFNAIKPDGTLILNPWADSISTYYTPTPYSHVFYYKNWLGKWSKMRLINKAGADFSTKFVGHATRLKHNNALKINGDKHLAVLSAKGESLCIYRKHKWRSLGWNTSHSIHSTTAQGFTVEKKKVRYSSSKKNIWVEPLQLERSTFYLHSWGGHRIAVINPKASIKEIDKKHWLSSRNELEMRTFSAVDKNGKRCDTSFYILKKIEPDNSSWPVIERYDIYSTHFEFLAGNVDAIYSGYENQTFFHDSTVESKRIHYPIVLKDNEVFPLLPFLGGDSTPIQKNGGNPKAPFSYRPKSGRTLYISKNGQLINLQEDRRNWGFGRFIGADSLFILFSRPGLYSIEKGKIVGKSPWNDHAEILGDNILSVDGYRFGESGNAICETYDYVKYYTNGSYLACQAYNPNYRGKREMNLLGQNCNNIIIYLIEAIAEWNDSTRTGFVASSRREENYQDYNWSYVKVDDAGTPSQLLKYELLEPYSLSPKGFQLMKTAKGVGLLNPELEVVLEPEFKNIYAFHELKFLAIDNNHWTIYNHNGQILAQVDANAQRKIISTDFLLCGSNGDIEISWFSGERTQLAQLETLTELKQVIARLLPNYEKVISSLSDLDKSKQYMVLMEILNRALRGRSTDLRLVEINHPDYPFPISMIDAQRPLVSAEPIKYNSNTPFIKVKSINEQSILYHHSTSTVSLMEEWYDETGNVRHIWHSLSNYTIDKTGLNPLRIDNVLVLNEENKAKLDSMFSNFVATNHQAGLTCEGNQFIYQIFSGKAQPEQVQNACFESAKHYFSIGKNGLSFYFYNHQCGESIPFLIPKEQLEGMLKIEL